MLNKKFRDLLRIALRDKIEAYDKAKDRVNQLWHRLQPEDLTEEEIEKICKTYSDVIGRIEYNYWKNRVRYMEEEK